MTLTQDPAPVEVAEEETEEAQEIVEEEEEVVDLLTIMVIKREMALKDKTRENRLMRTHGNGDIETKKDQSMKK